MTIEAEVEMWPAEAEYYSGSGELGSGMKVAIHAEKEWTEQQKLRQLKRKFLREGRRITREPGDELIAFDDDFDLYLGVKPYEADYAEEDSEEFEEFMARDEQLQIKLERFIKGWAADNKVRLELFTA